VFTNAATLIFLFFVPLIFIFSANFQDFFLPKILSELASPLCPFFLHLDHWVLTVDQSGN